ncbi:hydrogen peroxide-inducible genes activator [Halovulum sp. GXIMD14793]
MSNDFTLKQLRYFVALADMHNFRRAAERVGVSQPSLSQQIVALEGALGLELVERGRRGAVLTPGGRRVLEQARKVIEEAAVLHAHAAGARDGTHVTIRLGSTPTLGPYFLPFVMRRLHEDYPALKVVVRDAAPLVLQDELLEGRHDLILTQLPVRSSDLAVKRLFREPLKLVVAQDHPMTRKVTVTDADLTGEDMLALSSGYLLQSQVSALSEEVGGNLRQDYEGTSLDALRHMAALNMGVAFLPALYVNSEVSEDTGDVKTLSFRNDQFTRSIGLVWRHRSAHGDLIKRIGEVAKSVAYERFRGLVTVE